MMPSSPVAAHAVNFGKILKAEGRIRPATPASSQAPMNRTSAGICITHAIFCPSTAIGVATFIYPVMVNTRARRICTIHKLTFSARLGRMLETDIDALVLIAILSWVGLGALNRNCLPSALLDLLPRGGEGR